MQKVYDLFEAMLADESLIAVSVSRPVNKKSSVRKVSVRPIILRGHLHYQFTYHQGQQVKHRNLSRQDSLAELKALVGHSFRQAQVFSQTADYHIIVSAKGKSKILTRPPSRQENMGPTGHNRDKNYIIPANKPCAFLHRLGIMNKQGQVLPSRMAKFKQINRFLEMVDDIVKHLPTDRELQIIDFGSGKSYLTFALFHYLHEPKQLAVRIRGIDLKEDVVHYCNTLAQDLGWSQLSFWAGDIKYYEQTEPVDMMVSLHACDTATDIALAKAVLWRSKVILAAPCYQHELFRQIDNEQMRPLLRHGILKERLAALITDSLRASALEIMGYDVQVLEFVETEHTAKNLLIRAILSPQAKDSSQVAAEYLTFRNAWSVKQPAIETALGHVLQKHLSSQQIQ